MASGGSLGALSDHEIAYDSVRGRCVVFGGNRQVSIQVDETREWDGSGWSLLAPAVRPSRRDLHALTFDSARMVTVLFGGNSNGAFLNDTWTWDGGNWTRRAPTTAPSPREWAGMAYDGRRHRAVLFGGVGIGLTSLDDTWEWDGSNWLLRLPATRPAGRSDHGMIYDASRGVVVMFGGRVSPFDPYTGFDETWEWDGSNWTQALPVTRPPRRTGFGMAYDSLRQRTVAYGGNSALPGFPYSDTWEWDGVNWLPRSPTTAPAGRSDAAMAFDEARGASVLYGGLTGIFSPSDETWRYDAVTPARVSAFGSGCAGTRGIPGLAAQSGQRPWLGDSFGLVLSSLPATAPAFLFFGFSRASWAGVPLPIDLTPIGLTGCSLYVDIPLVFTAPTQGGSATFTFPIPPRPDLLNFQFFTQGFCVDSPANPFGATLSNGLANTIGGR